MPSSNQIQTAKSIESANNISEKIKSPRKIVLPPINQEIRNI
jgi:hypothetical protein